MLGKHISTTLAIAFCAHKQPQRMKQQISSIENKTVRPTHLKINNEPLSEMAKNESGGLCICIEGERKTVNSKINKQWQIGLSSEDLFMFLKCKHIHFSLLCDQHIFMIFILRHSAEWFRSTNLFHFEFFIWMFRFACLGNKTDNVTSEIQV